MCMKVSSANGGYFVSMISASIFYLTEVDIRVGKQTIIGLNNGLAPERRQAIIWTNDEILLIGHLRTNFSEIWIGIQTFSFKKMHLKMSSAKWRPFCLGLDFRLVYSHLQYWPQARYHRLQIYTHWALQEQLNIDNKKEGSTILMISNGRSSLRNIVSAHKRAHMIMAHTIFPWRSGTYIFTLLMDDFVLLSAIKQGNMRNCGLVTQLGVVVFNRHCFQGRRNRWQPITWSNSDALLPKETIWKYSTPVSTIKQMISHKSWTKLLTQLIHCALVTSYDYDTKPFPEPMLIYQQKDPVVFS